MIGFKEHRFLQGPIPLGEPATLSDTSKLAFGLLVDMASLMYILSNSHSLPELVALRLGANSAIHIGLDLVSTAVDRITHFRPPSAATLAV